VISIRKEKNRLSGDVFNLVSLVIQDYLTSLGDFLKFKEEPIMKRLSLKIILVTLALLVICATVVMFSVPVSAQSAWLWPAMMVGCCFVSVAICFFAAVIAKMKKSGQHLSLVNMYRYALLLLTSGFEKVAAFMRSSQRWLVRGASILATITICAISIGAIAVFFGLATAFQTGIVVLAVTLVAFFAVMIKRVMNGFTFNAFTFSFDTGFNGPGTGFGSNTTNKMNQHSMWHGQIKPPDSKYGHVSSQTSSSTDHSVSGAGFIKTHDDT